MTATNITRRQIVAGLASLAIPAIPANASIGFPAQLYWNSRLGELPVPFIMTGQAGDANAFQLMFARMLRSMILEDMPGLLLEAKQDPSIYVQYSQGIAGRLEQVEALPAPPAPRIGDANVTMTYATIAATAALIRWRYAALSAMMSILPVAKARQQDRITVVPDIENAGLAYGYRLLDYCQPHVKPNDGSNRSQAFYPWQLAYIASQTDKYFLPLHAAPIAPLLSELAFASGYEALIEGNRISAFHNMAAAHARNYAENQLLMPNSRLYTRLLG